MSESTAPSGRPRGAGPAMVVAALLGVLYLAWISWTEGWRSWIVLVLVLLVALFAGLAHRLFALTRR